jgi:uridine phosphorylase
MSKIPQSELILNKDGSVYHLNLKPKDISDNIIVVGDPGRVYRVSSHFDDIEFEMNKREFITHTGRYKGKRLTVISTGMGTDNIEIFLNELDALVNVDLKKREIKPRKKKLKIIRIGTSGSIQEDIPVGSHLVSDYAIGLDTLMFYYKFPQSEFEKGIAEQIQSQIGLGFTPYVSKCSDKLKKSIAFDMAEGNTITSPGFYGPQGRKIRLELKLPKMVEDLTYFHHNGFWLTNFEMEASALYGLGKLFGHEVLCLNAIIANRIKKTFSKDHNKVIDSLIQKVIDRI